jgi:tetratricopeptide (TPR) repeat protein
MARNRDDRDGMQAAVDELDRLRALCAQHPDTAEAGLDAAIEAADLRSLMSACAEALSGIDAVLAALPAHSGGPELRRARALLVRSQALNGCGRPGEGAAAGEAALALDNLPLALQGRLLHSIVYAHFLDSRIGDALAGAERTLLLWRSTGNRRSIARAHANIGLMSSQLGRHDVAKREMGHALALAREMRMHELEREVLLNLAYMDLQEGQPQAALDALESAWNASPTFADSSTPVFIRGMQVHGHAHQGQLGLALSLAEDAHRRAVELDESHALTDCVSMILDLATDSGDFALAERWVASLPARERMESQYRTKLVFNLVHLALVRGDLAGAEAELQTLGDVAALSQPYDRCYAALRHAELSLARGDGDGALAWLARGQPDATHIEARALMLAARMRALALLEGAARSAEADADAARAEAAALLGGPATVPAFAALALCEACGFERADRVRRLAGSLDVRPAARESFLARWAAQGLQR